MIPAARERWQRLALVRGVGAVLGLWTALLLFLLKIDLHSRTSALTIKGLLISLTFAAAVWALRAATPAAALLGALICLNITVWTGSIDQSVWRSGLTPLLGLFVLTFLATRIGRRFGSHVSVRDASSEKKGRDATQIVANLGAAALAAFIGPGSASGWNKVAVLAALAEATADTVSSEIGAAFGGHPWMITNWTRVDPGTEGAVSVTGTAAGAAAAFVVATAGGWAMGLPPRMGAIALAGGVLGLLCDSLLGATLERRGLLGNDWVNFLSTVIASASAFAFATLF